VTAIYYVLRFAWTDYLARARIQFGFDVLLVTWLVWITGNANSPYAALYIVIISVASLFVGPRGAMITSIACRRVQRVRPGGSRCGSAGFSSEAVANTIRFVGLSDVSFLVVGLLAAKLAHRQTRSIFNSKQPRDRWRFALHERIVESIRSGVVYRSRGPHLYLQCRCRRDHRFGLPKFAVMTYQSFGDMKRR
jgi:hypothetical protein